MKNSTLVGKIFSQIGIFVVSGLLAGILLLAIQANKLPGIKQDVQQVPQKDDVTPEDKERPVEQKQEIISHEITADYSAYDKKTQTNLGIIKEVQNNFIENQFQKDLTSITPNISSSSILLITQITSDISKSSNTTKISDTQTTSKIIESPNASTLSNVPTSSTISKSLNISETSISSKTSNKTASPVAQKNLGQLPTRQKLFVSVSCGVSPLFFSGHNFANDFFQDNSVIFSPVSTIGLTFPQKSGFTYSVYLSAASSSLNLKSPQIYDSINLNFKTSFILTKIDFSIMHKIFSEKNLAEAHLGTGIIIFNNPSCIINQTSYNKNNTVDYTFDFGFSLKHFFSEHFFTAAVCDFSLVFPYTEQLFIIQPALIAGLNF